MATGKPSKKPATSAPGVKLLITAASLAATLGGWAMISAEEPEPTPTPAPAPVLAAAPVVTIKLAPLPTLVPPITPQPQVVTVNQPRAAASAPQPAAPTELVLRDVSAPQVNAGGGRSAAPAPAANTGSSR